MKKITEKAANAFLAGETWRESNTRVQKIEDRLTGKTTVFLTLYTTDIAKYEISAKHSDANVIGADLENKTLEGKVLVTIDTGTYATATTKERLNGLPFLNVFQSGYRWYLKWEDEEIHSEWDGSPISHYVDASYFTSLEETI